MGFETELRRVIILGDKVQEIRSNSACSRLGLLMKSHSIESMVDDTGKK